MWKDFEQLKHTLRQVDTNLQLLFPVHCNMFPQSVLVVCLKHHSQENTDDDKNNVPDVLMLRVKEDNTVLELPAKLMEQVFTVRVIPIIGKPNKFEVMLPPMSQHISLQYKLEKHEYSCYYPFPEQKRLAQITKIDVHITLTKEVTVEILTQYKSETMIAREVPAVEFVQAIRSFFQKS